MNDFTEEFGDSIAIISSIIKKFKNDQHQIIFKIGIFESGKFCRGLQSIDFFNKIKSLLDSNHFWDAQTTEKTTESICDKITVSGMSKFKTNVLNTTDFSYQNTPFDFRVLI